MWPTEYVVHEHRKNLERTAAEIRLSREASTQPTRWMIHARNLMRMFRIRRRRPQPMMQPKPQPMIWQAVRRAN